MPVKMPSEEEMYEKVFRLIRDERYVPHRDEITPAFINYFYACYENIIYEFNMSCIPICFDKQEKSFKALPAFIKNVELLELQKWRDMFRRHYQDNPLPFEELPELEYRISNYMYAESVILKLTGETSSEEIQVDPYGWIEDRRAILFENLSYYAETYKVPRLPVILEPTPRFLASEQEIADFCTLLNKRRDRLEDSKLEIRNLKDAAMFGISSDLSEQQTKSHEKQIDDFYKIEAEKIKTEYQEKWQKENKDYLFPHALKKYTSEIVHGFSESIPVISKEQEMKLPQSDFYKPGQNLKLPGYLQN